MTALERPAQEEGLRNRKAAAQQSSNAELPEERETQSVTRSPQREGPRQSLTGKEVAKDESKATKIVVRLVSGGCMVSFFRAMLSPSSLCTPVRKYRCW
jgi:hypothetical protein